LTKLSKDFYTRNDVVKIARELIGKELFTCIHGQLTSGIIVETEAYHGRKDKACHAYPDVHTARTEIMYKEGGRAYVYLCYGIHHLFNVVTNKEGKADAVLIRAIEPRYGLDYMLFRRKLTKASNKVSSGPGKVGQALGISTVMTNISLLGDQIWIEDKDINIDIETSTRIGVEYAEEAALFNWRFLAKNNVYVSNK